jgi:hypothetical protein
VIRDNRIYRHNQAVKIIDHKITPNIICDLLPCICEVTDSNVDPENGYRDFCDFPQILQANVEQYLKMGHNRSLPHTSQLTVQISFNCSALHTQSDLLTVDRQ